MELPGHPPQPIGQVPPADSGDPEAHAQRPPGQAAPGGGGEENQAHLKEPCTKCNKWNQMDPYGSKWFNLYALWVELTRFDLRQKIQKFY